MIVENSFKISMNKAGLVWRIFLYQLVTLILISGICLACFYPLFDHLFECGFFDGVRQFFADNAYNFSVGSIFSEIGAKIIELWTILTSSAYLLIMAILFVVVFVVLFTICSAMLEIAVCECVYGFMGSYTKLNFFGSFVSNLWRGLKFAFCRLFTVVLFDLVIIGGVSFAFCQFGHSSLLDTLLPFVIILGFVLLTSLKQSLFALWIPNMVTNNESIWKSFGQNFKLGAKNFKTVFGITIMSVVVVFALHFGLGLLTCGVGLLISIPASVLFFNVLYTVMFFHFSGLKYYVDKDKIITPKKLEDLEKIGNIGKII